MKILKLQVAKDIEPLRSWEEVKTPYDLAVYISRVTGIDISNISALSEIAVSSLQPTGLESNKLWIKSEGMPGIGLPIGGSYQMIYQYPPNIPLLWINTDDALPREMYKISASDLEEYGLAAPTKGYWVIFQP